MAHHARLTITVAMAAGLFGLLRGLSAQEIAPEEPLTAYIHVDNVARLSIDQLHMAKYRAGDIFGRAGVRLSWSEDPGTRAPDDQRFTLVIANATRETFPSSRVADPLGFAIIEVRRAYVFSNKVEAMRILSPPNIGIVFGNVLAHELGHVMLGVPGHSAVGIMRPEAYIREWSEQTFTEAQAREIRSRLQCHCR